MSFEMFSPTEKVIIKIIGRRKITIAEITEKYLEDADPAPITPNNYIGLVVRRIVAKCNHYKLNWTLDGVGTGRGGRTVWRALRGKHADKEHRISN